MWWEVNQGPGRIGEDKQQYHACHLGFVQEKNVSKTSSLYHCWLLLHTYSRFSVILKLKMKKSESGSSTDGILAPLLVHQHAPKGWILIGNLIDMHGSLWNQTSIYERFILKNKWICCNNILQTRLMYLNYVFFQFNVIIACTPYTKSKFKKVRLPKHNIDKEAVVVKVASLPPPPIFGVVPHALLILPSPPLNY